MAINTLGNQTTQAKQFYDRLLLERGLPVMAMYNAGQMRSIPKNNGNQVSYRRFETLATATTALSEGITPVGTSLTITEITATVAQYGNFVEYSDQIDHMGIDPVTTEAMELLGENAGETIELITRAELVSGTSVLYATGSNRAAQSASNPLTLNLAQKGVRNLKANRAKPFKGALSKQGQGGLMYGIIHPYAMYDLKNDQAVEDMFKYSTPDGLISFTLPVIGGVAWYETDLAPVFAGAGSGGADVYATLIIGKDAFGVCDVAGTGKFENIVKPLGSAGAADPLNQRGTMGWKAYQMPKILNNNFFTRIEHGVTA